MGKGNDPHCTSAPFLPDAPAATVLEVPTLRDIKAMSPERARQLTVTLRFDERIPNTLYRTLMRRAGYRGLHAGSSQGPDLARLLEGHPDTVSLHTMRDVTGRPVLDMDGREQLTINRQAMHLDAVAEHTAHLTASARPTVTCVLGGPGSGKSTVTATLPHLAQAQIAINPDDYMRHVPEYEQFVATGDPAAASVVYREKKLLTQAITDAAMTRRADMVMDVTGNQGPGVFAAQLQRLADRGYRVRCVYVFTDAHIALDRACSRGRKDGRWMTDEILLDSHQSVSARFQEIVGLDLVEDLQVWDNNDVQPRLIAARPSPGQPLEIADPASFESFVATGRRDLRSDTGIDV